MQSKLDQLLESFEKVVKEPWSAALSGQERIWFLVYDPAEQRKVDLRLGDFETATMKSGKKWKGISMKLCFPSWMALDMNANCGLFTTAGAPHKRNFLLFAKSNNALPSA